MAKNSLTKYRGGRYLGRMRNANRRRVARCVVAIKGLYIPRGVADTTRVRSPHSPLVRVTTTIAPKSLFFKDLRWPTY